MSETQDSAPRSCHDAGAAQTIPSIADELRSELLPVMGVEQENGRVAARINGSAVLTTPLEQEKNANQLRRCYNLP